MTKLTEAQFSMQCAFIAKNAAAWAGDILTLPERCNEPAEAKTVARFTSDMRGRLDRLDEWAGVAALTLKDDPGNGAEAERKFKLGDRVAKKSGSSWHGQVVGFYNTYLTPIGYCVESEREFGSVQIYPEAAIDFAPDPHDWHTDDEGDR
jgi:hypothetical protein